MGKLYINPEVLNPKKEWKRHKIKDGSNVLRFLRQKTTLNATYPFKKWTIIWGLIDHESGRSRPYASSLSTEKKCPVTEYVDLLIKKAESIKHEMESEGHSETQIKDRLKDLNKVIATYRPKTSYAWNAVDKAGMVGIVELKATAHKKLKALMASYIEDYDQDPTSVFNDDDDSGVWFDVTREGTFFDTKYDVKKVQLKQKINGHMTYVDDRSPLPDSIKDNWENMVYDLSTIYVTKTYDELKELLLLQMPTIVKECPDALVDEFSVEVECNDEEVSEDEIEEVEEIKPVIKKNAVAAKPKASLNLKEDDDSEEDDLPKFASPKAAVKAEVKPTVKAKVAVDESDPMALAEAILGRK